MGAMSDLALPDDPAERARMARDADRLMQLLDELERVEERLRGLVDDSLPLLATASRDLGDDVTDRLLDLGGGDLAQTSQRLVVLRALISDLADSLGLVRSPTTEARLGWGNDGMGEQVAALLDAVAAVRALRDRGLS